MYVHALTPTGTTPAVFGPFSTLAAAEHLVHELARLGGFVRVEIKEKGDA